MIIPPRASHPFEIAHRVGYSEKWVGSGNRGDDPYVYRTFFRASLFLLRPRTGSWVPENALSPGVLVAGFKRIRLDSELIRSYRDRAAKGVA